MTNAYGEFWDLVEEDSNKYQAEVEQKADFSLRTSSSQRSWPSSQHSWSSSRKNDACKMEIQAKTGVEIHAEIDRNGYNCTKNRNTYSASPDGEQPKKNSPILSGEDKEKHGKERRRKLLDINPEGALSKEIKDILDELHIMKKVFKDQLMVVVTYSEHLKEIDGEKTEVPHTSVLRSKRLGSEIERRIKQIDDLVDAAKHTAENVRGDFQTESGPT
jgi:hypothetical protein